MNKLIPLVLVVSIACSHQPQAQFDSHLEGQKCEDAMGSIPEFQRSEKAARSASWMANSTVAYTYVGLNYSAEVLWDVGVGTIVVVALCAPVVLAAPSGGGSLQCIPAKISLKNVMAPPLGRKAWEQTHDMRCPNVEPLVLSLEKVATCFEKRQTKAGRDLAITTLNNIENSKYFFSCVKQQTSDRITAKRLELEAMNGGAAN